MTKKAQFWIGTSGWSYDDWKGKFYPEDCAKSHWLEYYTDEFNAVEVNATFYRSFPATTYTHWQEKAPDNFRYVIKLSRYITHRKYLLQVKTSIHRAEKSANILKDKLGLILMQLPPNMPYNLARLETAFAAFHDPSRLVVEFRDPKWLTDEVKELLIRYNVIFCNVDGPNSRINEWLTSNIAYIRLHGRKQLYKHNYTKAELEEVAEHLQNLVRKGAKELYVFFNNDYDAHAANNAKTLKLLLDIH